MTPLNQMGHDLLAMQRAIEFALLGSTGEAKELLQRVVDNMDQIQQDLTDLDDGLLEDDDVKYGDLDD